MPHDIDLTECYNFALPRPPVPRPPVPRPPARGGPTIYGVPHVIRATQATRSQATRKGWPYYIRCTPRHSRYPGHPPLQATRKGWPYYIRCVLHVSRIVGPSLAGGLQRRVACVPAAGLQRRVAWGAAALSRLQHSGL